jgi:hypothetical protein
MTYFNGLPATVRSAAAGKILSQNKVRRTIVVSIIFRQCLFHDRFLVSVALSQRAALFNFSTLNFTVGPWGMFTMLRATFEVSS